MVHRAIAEIKVRPEAGNRIIKTITMRPTEEDCRLIDALTRKLGVSASSVIRQSLRLLAEKEKVGA